MKSTEEVDELKRLLGQLSGLHAEISQLAKKSPNDGVNSFKLKLVNKVLSAGNAILGKGYRPFQEFAEFDVDDVPTNSDVTMILAQYIEQAERYRSDNVIYDTAYQEWRYVVAGRTSSVEAAPPSRIGDKK